MRVSMRRPPMIVALFCMVCGIATPGCKSSEFTGSAGTKPAVEKQKTPETETEKPVTPEKEKKERPNTDDPDAPIETEEDPVETIDETKPDTGTDSDQSLIPSILDIISGLKKILIPDDTINDENRIVFGNAKGFHIGDDNFDPNSNCATTLKAHNINGTKYFFEFEVKKDDTTIDMTINEVCGVDYADTNFASIEDAAGTSLQKKTIPNNNAIKYDSITLKTGKYKMVVESTPNQANNGDRDDFMVKKLEIKSNKPIVAGKIGAL